jgi:hypothetical protein
MWGLAEPSSWLPRVIRGGYSSKVEEILAHQQGPRPRLTAEPAVAVVLAGCGRFWFWLTCPWRLRAFLAGPVSLVVRRGGFMRNRIFGGIGVVWGGAILIYALFTSGSQAQGAYGAGQMGGVIFGVVLFGVGLYYLVKGGSTKKE